MKSPSKLILGATTAAAIIAPFTPKTVNINISEPPAIVAEDTHKTCTVVTMIINDRGQRFCEYRCGSHVRIIPATSGYCERTLEERFFK